MKVYENMIDEFLINAEKVQAVAITATKNIFKLDGNDPTNNIKVELLHTAVDRGFFFCKISRTDIQPTTAVLCTRVKHPNQGYLNKLMRLVKYILGTQ